MLKHVVSRLIVLGLLSFCALALIAVAAPSSGPFIELPKAGLKPNELAVLYLKDDSQSEAIARYYQAQRNIPAANVIAVTFEANQTKIGPGEFAVQKKLLDGKLDDTVQALVLAWAQPYQVGCMSISAAFAFGYDVAYCSTGCEITRTSPYYHSGSSAPFRDFNIRPTMMLAANDLDKAFDLIHRGIEADDTQPLGRAFLLNTSDKNRSVRKMFFPEIKRQFDNAFDVQIINGDAIKNRSDILFYFTGAKSVPYLDTLEFLPGAMADHLTSLGGRLTDSGQMSAMRWLEAGATGSYGAAIEPCNFVQKFPNPLLAMWHYSAGSTLIEAYWKSVHMPGQGNFIGEPLAAPFNGYRLIRKPGRIEIHSPVLRHGRYRIIADDGGLTDFIGSSSSRYSQMMENVSTQSISPYRSFLELKPPYRHRYRIERIVSDR